LGLAAAVWVLTSTRPVAGQAPLCAPSGTSSLWTNFVQAKLNGTEPILPDFSYAGYHRSEIPIPDVGGPVFDVTAHGALPGDAVYDDEAIQAAINAAAAAGVVVVYFPAGQYLVSPSETSATTIRISASRIVLRGAGSGEGGTEIVMVSKRQGLTMFNVVPTSWGATTVANVTACATRETLWVTVDSTAQLSVGQWVVLRHQSTQYSAAYWGGLALSPSWTRVYGSGTGVHEVHQIAEIAGKEVRFREPLHFNVVRGASPWRLEAVNPLEEIGIEDIRFNGRWDELRSERSGNLAGRVYTITVESRDASGNASRKTVEVVVPKSGSR
jgi:hypothetical protein